MRAAFGRDALLDAFDQIGRAAALAGTKLQIAVYGGSALMLASNFRFATEDVDVSELERPLPGWLATVVDKIAKRKWLAGRLVQRWGRVSPQLTRRSRGRSFGVRNISARRWCPAGACGFGSIGRIFAGSETESGAGDGLRIRGETERLDILNLMQVVGISTAEEAIALLGRYFPVSAASSEKQRFLLKNMNREGGVDAPEYPR